MGFKRWIPPLLNDDLAAQLSREAGIAPLVSRILVARGLRSAGEVNAFLGREAALDDPFALKDMDQAVALIHEAIAEDQQIAVYGDYDCDGVTSTALLVSYLQSVGARVFYYIPDREGEGYGMNLAAVEQLHKMNVDLLVTVDNGISAHAEIARARELGMRVVVTDHHTPRETLPDAHAVVNPHRADCPSGRTELAGVGVAFKLVCALEEDGGDELLEYYSDLVMLGTVADVVPLVGENRIIVRHGLARLPETERAGLNALMECSGVAGKTPTSEGIAFSIIPRLNAAGRMGSADDAVELLLTDDVPYAAELAEGINAANEQRKGIEEGILAEIEGTLAAQPELLDRRLLLCSGEGWHHGVVGIVAAKLMEKYGKPTILFSRDGECARGSGRSLEGFSLIGAISACSARLTQFGGHTLAAGLSLPCGELEAFEEELETWAGEHHAQMPLPLCAIDCELRAAELTPETIASLQLLEPFGAGNRAPLFLLRDLQVDRLMPTADGKHLRIRFASGKTNFVAVFFRTTEAAFPYNSGDRVDLVASVSLGEYNGKAQVSVIGRDVRLSGVEQDSVIQGDAAYACHLRGEYGAVCQKADLLPTREDVAAVYRYLRGHPGYRYGRAELFFRLSPSGLSYAKMLVALDVLEELELVSQSDENGVRTLTCAPNPPKVELSASRILTQLGENS